jgi:sugar lactone lactonase YvrE
MTVTSNVVTGTITSNTSILYTAPSSGVSKLVNFTVTNNSANNAVINIDSVDSSADNFEAYTAKGAAYSGDPFSVTSQESSPDGVAFNDTGTKMYAVGSSQDRIFEYDLTTAWDITTATYNGANTSISVSSPGDITFGNNGLKVYVGWTNTFGTGVELDLSVAYDITSVTASSTILYNSPWTGSDYYTIPGFSFNDDGTKVYVLATYSSKKLVEMPLATAWDVSSAIFASRVELSLPSVSIVSSAVPSSDGKRFYYTDTTGDVVREIELTTAWDLSTATDSVRTFSVSSQTTSPGGIALGDSDSKLFIMSTGLDTIFKYNLSFFGEEYIDPWTLSNPSFAHKSPLLSSQEASPYGLDFKSDGTKLYVIGTSAADILQYSLSTPFNVSTATYDSIATTGLVSSGNDLVFKRDGTKVFVIDAARYVEEYNLSTAWDLSTISSMVNQIDTEVEFGNNGQYGLYIKPDGTRLYVGSVVSPYIQQYNLSTAWDLSTATANSTVGTTATYGIGFKDDGTIMFSTEPGNILRKWNLSTPWEINTAVSDSTYDLNNLESAAGTINTVYSPKLIHSKSQIAVIDRNFYTILTFNIYESAGVGVATAGKHSLRKSSTVFPNQTSKINIGALVMDANTDIRASSTEDISYSITTQELSGDIASGFSVENKSLTLGTLKQTILEATSNVRIYGCQVTNFNGASTATFTTYLNDTPIVSSKQIEAGDSVLGITPGLSLTAGDVLSIEPGGIGDIQVSLTYETY